MYTYVYIYIDCLLSLSYKDLVLDIWNLVLELVFPCGNPIQLPGIRSNCPLSPSWKRKEERMRRPMRRRQFRKHRCTRNEHPTHSAIPSMR